MPRPDPLTGINERASIATWSGPSVVIAQTVKSVSPQRDRGASQRTRSGERGENGSDTKARSDRRRTEAVTRSRPGRGVRLGRSGDDTNSARSRRRPARPASGEERAARSRARGPDAARARDLAALSSRPAPCAGATGPPFVFVDFVPPCEAWQSSPPSPASIRQCDKVVLGSQCRCEPLIVRAGRRR
jgi:hypothetical protein